MNGKWPALVLILSGLAAGIGVWYTQEYGFYTRSDDPEGGRSAQPVTRADGTMTTLAVRDYHQIDGDSSPIKWRACFRLAEPAAAADLHPFDKPTPLIAPRWFDCFDAGRLSEDLASGAAVAVLAQAEIRPDVDRVLAIYPDGRAYGWQQLNDKTPPRGVMD